MVQLQSLSFASVQPGGQQLSPPMHWVIAVPLHVPLLHVLFVMQALAFMHGMPWFAGWPPPQIPDVHVSPVLQTSMVEHAVPLGEEVMLHVSSTSLHRFCLQGSLVGGQVVGVPAQTPLLQTSLVVQKRPSEHDVPSGFAVCTQPVIESQPPVWHMSLRNEQLMGTVPMHEPLAQLPLVKHLSFIGMHVIPSLPGIVLHVFEGSSHAPTLHASTPGHIFGVPLHTPIAHVSPTVQ
jgi:hypothetical protein